MKFSVFLFYVLGVVLLVDATAIHRVDKVLLSPSSQLTL
jgi:hypothetical protein